MQIQNCAGENDRNGTRPWRRKSKTSNESKKHAKLLPKRLPKNAGLYWFSLVLLFVLYVVHIFIRNSVEIKCHCAYSFHHTHTQTHSIFNSILFILLPHFLGMRMHTFAWIFFTLIEREKRAKKQNKKLWIQKCYTSSTDQWNKSTFLLKIPMRCWRCSTYSLSIHVHSHSFARTEATQPNIIL